MVNHPRRSRTASRPARDHDAEYEAFRSAVWDGFRDLGPLFQTDAEGLFDLYLDNLPAERQVHNCSACRSFFNHFGGIVTVSEDGQARSAMWYKALPDFYEQAIKPVLAAISKARITGPFLSSLSIWGTPQTPGPWMHLCVPAPKPFRHQILTPGQAMAAKRKDFRTVATALADFTPDMLAQAMRLLEADTLARSERFIGPVQWLQELHEKRSKVRNARLRDNILWRAIATAPDGYCHPRASMVGTLLDDIAAGMPFDEVKARFDAKMHPLRYQRPQAAPKAGNIAQAEKVFDQMGLAPALERRFARLDECETLWRPMATKTPVASGGVFSHLHAKSREDIATLDLPTQTMTWEKFSRVVLPEAETIAAHVPTHGNFIALLTAVNVDAPAILRWDREDRRNPVSHYVYHNGSPASSWGLRGGSWCPVTALVPYPNMWGTKPLPHLMDGLVIVLQGAADSRTGQGNALFPECLRDELHAVRATIEAYSKRAAIHGREDASACGLGMQKGKIGYRLRVTSRGQTADYHLDRWD